MELKNFKINCLYEFSEFSEIDSVCKIEMKFTLALEKHNCSQISPKKLCNTRTLYSILQLTFTCLLCLDLYFAVIDEFNNIPKILFSSLMVYITITSFAEVSAQDKWL